ncbi:MULTISPECIES: spore coat U domain-containing protein [Acinetobacter]|uniref:Spore coat U domain-containing protein n=4 Tax=Acinetobacter seifertii TaxID=1530123 RepID=A0ABX8L2V5_9GAMM|nr:MULTISPECIES: spore coat U domain-containing protein [Acinetobacter]MBJ8463922.1 spore coat protein U domain-containing protein [Acinetobacter nosocomialis]MBP1487613.1 spore coat protein U domain-containing protein [Acinetobacter nosocomialis]MBP1498186.1 spore coat protein U domain-containing protein [Acinetobacter nosocomialis]MBR7690417.1 spore coat protein U domain-containing protein [Acinetobacter nosocomialis]MBR7728671.1 spore coat protein U domain-containing protein [Acinetobacter 
MTMKKTFFYLSALAIALISVNAANAATATGTLTVKATVTNSCVLNTSATGTTTNAVLDFGTLSSLTSNVDADTTTTGGTAIKVLCNNTVPWTLSFDGGQNVLSTQRRMIGGATSNEYIPYNLYSDTGRGTAIGIATTAYSGTGSGAVQTVNVYGRLPAGSALPSAGSYVDTVTVTVTY